MKLRPIALLLPAFSAATAYQTVSAADSRALDVAPSPSASAVSGSTEPHERAQDARSIPLPGLFWALFQLVPSPEIATSDGQAHAGMRWQITPLVVSWGVSARPVRTFVIEPIARHAGSIEAFISPELLGGSTGNTDWLGRAGGRIYLPLWQRGENLSFSLGGSYYLASDHQGASAELGIYTLYGTFGLLFTYSPGFDRRQLITTLNIRYF